MSQITITFPNPSHLTVKEALTYCVWWSGFWQFIYFIAPPREWFKSQKWAARYDLFLKIVNYYGALNIRGFVMKLYGAHPQDAPPIPPKPEKPAGKDSNDVQ